MTLRTSLARLTRRDPDRPTLRERFAATKAKAADIRSRAALAAKVGRIAFTPPAPEPQPADRNVLITYATWLFHERVRVCAELYPHRGTAASTFVLGLNAGEDWHYNGRDRNGGWAKKPPATPRAIAVLDAVGVDWRPGSASGGPVAVEGSAGIDTGKRPEVPHGWPALDAALVAAVADAQRVYAMLNAIPSPADRDADELPEWRALKEAVGISVDTLTRTPAKGLPGLQAKARAILAGGFMGGDEDALEIAHGLAQDLVGATQRHLEPRPDPIHAAIEESQRLMQAWTAIDQSRQPPQSQPSAEWGSASTAFHEHADEKLLATVPTTARGCAALARYAIKHHASEGWTIDEGNKGTDHLRVLELIARSPLL